jgi:hypothetical protein
MRVRRRGARRGIRAAGSVGRRVAALLVLFPLGCAPLGMGASREGYEKLVRSNRSAREQLAFGMSREQATAIMGEAEVRPPWANDLGIGPQVVRNPFDTLRFESPAGETYEVLRYAVDLRGEPRCPFVHGNAVLVPLIFLEDKLVGWRWSYMESVLQRALREDERTWVFGRFCGRTPEGADVPRTAIAAAASTWEGTRGGRATPAAADSGRQEIANRR